MLYDDPPLPSHEEAESILASALRGEGDEACAGTTLIGLALYDDDRGFVEAWCGHVGRGAPDLRLRGTAALGVAHLGRRFGEVGEAAAALAVTPQPLDAAADLDQFVGPDWRDR